MLRLELNTENLNENTDFQVSFFMTKV